MLKLRLVIRRLSLFVAVCLWIPSVVAAVYAAGGRPQPPAAPTRDASSLRPVVDRYCVSCHSARVKTAGIVLEGMDVERRSDARLGEGRAEAARAARCRRRAAAARSGNLRRASPRGSRRRSIAPRARSRTRAVRALHRLNRAEYANAIRDLLALDVDAGVAAAARRLELRLRQHRRRARQSRRRCSSAICRRPAKISALAVGDPTIGPSSQTVSRARRPARRIEHVDGLPLGTRGGIAGPPHVPARRRVRHQGQAAADERRLRSAASRIRTSVEISDRRRARAPGDRSAAARTTSAALDERDRRRSTAIDARLQVARAGQGRPARRSASTFVHEDVGAARTPTLQPFLRSTLDRDRSRRACRTSRRVTITRPVQRDRPRRHAEPPAHLRRAVRRRARPTRRPCATHASSRRWRAAPTGARSRDADVEPLLALLRDGPARGRRSTPASSSALRAHPRRARSSCSASSAIRRTLPPGRRTASATSSWRRACRSSSGAAFPTTSCSTLAGAAAGCSDPAVLEQQVRRMLADPRARRARQQLRRPVAAPAQPARRRRPTRTQFPDFDDNLRQAFQRETELLLRAASCARTAASLDLLTADYTFVNERLAQALRHPERLRQPLPPRAGDRRSARGPARPGQHPDGHLARRPHLAGACAASGFSTTCSARRRRRRRRTCRALKENERRGDAADDARADGGAPREPGVRQLPQADGSARLRARELRRGRRVADAATTASPIDASGAARRRHDGRRRRSRCGRRCCSRPETFVGTMTEKLLTYALGRGLEHYDMPAVRAIVRGAAAQRLPLLVARARHRQERAVSDADEAPS